MTNNVVPRIENLNTETASTIHSFLVDEDIGKAKFPLRVFAGLNFLAAAITLIGIVLIAAIIVTRLSTGDINFNTERVDQAFILAIFSALALTAEAVLFVVFSVRIFRGYLKNAALLTDIMLAVATVELVLSLMTTGMYTFSSLISLINTIYLLVMHVYLDPQLIEERHLQLKLKQMEDRSDKEAGVLGRDKTGEGYIDLNFFNLFWIFFIASILGWVMEMLVCPILNGRIEDRTGMLWGPFSPIYGIGATLMTIALNRFYNKNPFAVFVIAGFIGAGFEFLVSWFFENAFGILAWDYSGEFLNIAGRTDFAHWVAWGFVGLIFLRYILPALLDLINKIPWNWRYGVTFVVAGFMFVNAFMTLTAFDCWFQRVSGIQPNTPVAQFFAENFDNEFMANHFQTMSIDPNRVTHG